MPPISARAAANQRATKHAIFSRGLAPSERQSHHS
jgi:hypothetical protein